MKHLLELDKKALDLINGGNFEQAIELYKKIIAENPNYEFGICFYQIACCFEELGKLEEAKENYLKAIEYNDEDDIRMGGFASFLYLYGDPEEAFQVHLKLLKLKKQKKADPTNILIALQALGKKVGLTEDEIAAQCEYCIQPMSEKFDQLVDLLFDNTARLDERDDAIISLGGLRDIRAIEPLRKLAADDTQDYLLKSSAGEAIARIMIELNVFDRKYLVALSDDATNEAINLLLAKKPEWKKMIDSILNE